MKDYPHVFLVRLDGHQRDFIRRRAKKVKNSEASVIRSAIENFELWLAS